MAASDPKKLQKKRKQVDDEILEPKSFSEAVGLEMLSDEEDDGASGSDNGEVDEFPEIDTRSDSDDADFEASDVEGSDEDEEDTEDLGEEGSVSDADSDLHIFPESKTIISDITGQPKLVYPEIEPDYDSDSSTEDVSHSRMLQFASWYISEHF